MKLLKPTTLATIFCLMALPALAAKLTPGSPDPAQKPIVLAKTNTSAGQSDNELSGKQAEFIQFAKEKIKTLNRNHNLSRSRMQVTKQPDGSWRAMYHQIDDSTMKVKVRRSQSKSIPYVGVLSYQEQVLEAYSKSPKKFDPEAFQVVQIIPNRHIFSYCKGCWN